MLLPVIIFNARISNRYTVSTYCLPCCVASTGVLRRTSGPALSPPLSDIYLVHFRTAEHTYSLLNVHWLWFSLCQKFLLLLVVFSCREVVTFHVAPAPGLMLLPALRRGSSALTRDSRVCFTHLLVGMTGGWRELGRTAAQGSRVWVLGS